MPPLDYDYDDDSSPRIPIFPSITQDIDTPTIITTATSTKATTTTATTTTSPSSPTSTCNPTNCPVDSRSCPPCKNGYTCRLSVAESSCQCPTASCVKITIESGINNGTDVLDLNNSTSSEKKSVLGPILGSIAGVIVIVVFTVLFIRYQRRKRRMNGDRLLDQQEGQSDGVNDKSNHIGQRWPGRLNDTKNQKDVITIAYIPSISDSEPFQLPELAHLGGGPHASFLDEEYDKHVSIASSLSTGTLDEAVVLAMNIKATPKLLKLNTIKENSDMIKRSNSLHSSNSIKRSQSQRKPIVRRIQKEENHKAGTSGDSTGMGPQDSSHEDNQQDQQQYTPAVMVTGPSARSSAQSEVSAKRKPRPPNMVLEPRPLHPSYHINQNPSTSNATPLKKLTTSKSTPIALPSTLTAMTNTILSPVSTSSSRSLPTKESEHARYSEEILENGERRGSWSAVANETGIHSDKAILNSPPRPFTRSSTFSTQSDARSTTTGEEIMIFWDGHRDSRSSDSIHSKWMT